MDELIKCINDLLKDETLPDRTKGMLAFLKEEFEVKINFSKNRLKSFKKALKMAKTKSKVQLGSGRHKLKDYINIDICCDPDVYWDVRDSLPFHNDSIEEIFSEHMLEHLDYPASVNVLLHESYRVLKDGGKFIVGVPDCSIPIKGIFYSDDNDMTIAKKTWYKNREDIAKNMKTNIDYLNYVMRDQLFNEKYHPHYWGYTKDNLSLFLRETGFKKIEEWKVDKNVINPKREWGTLYLSAIK